MKVFFAWGNLNFLLIKKCQQMRVEKKSRFFNKTTFVHTWHIYHQWPWTCINIYLNLHVHSLYTYKLVHIQFKHPIICWYMYLKKMSFAMNHSCTCMYYLNNFKWQMFCQTEIRNKEITYVVWSWWLPIRQLSSRVQIGTKAYWPWFMGTLNSFKWIVMIITYMYCILHCIFIIFFSCKHHMHDTKCTCIAVKAMSNSHFKI